MNKKIVFFAIALTIVLASCGPTNPLDDLTGDIIVESNEGARIWLNSNSVGTVDASGELLIQNVAAGTHTLRARLDGSEDIVKSVIVISEEVVTIDAFFQTTKDCIIDSGFSCIPAGFETIDNKFVKVVMYIENDIGKEIYVSGFELNEVNDLCNLRLDNTWVGDFTPESSVSMLFMNECNLPQLDSYDFDITVTYYENSPENLQILNGKATFKNLGNTDFNASRVMVCTGMQCEYVYGLYNPILYFYPGVIGKVFYSDLLTSEIVESELVYHGGSEDGITLTIFGQIRSMGFNESLNFYANDNTGLRVRPMSGIHDSTLDRLSIAFWPVTNDSTNHSEPTTGILSFTIYEQDNSNVTIPNVSVRVYNQFSAEEGLTDEEGSVSFNLSSVEWNYEIGKEGYENLSGTKIVSKGGYSGIGLALTKLTPSPVLPTSTTMTLRSNVLGTTFRTIPQTSTCVANQYDGSSNRYVCNIIVTSGTTYGVTGSVEGWHNMTKNIGVDNGTYALTLDFMLEEKRGFALVNVRNETLKGNPLQGINIRIYNSEGVDTSAATNSSGSWGFNLSIGTYNYQLRNVEHMFDSGTFTINTDQTISISKAYVVPSYYLRIRLSKYQWWGGTSNQFREFEGKLMPGNSITHTGYYSTTAGNACAAIVRVTMQNNAAGVQCVRTDHWGDCNYKDVDNQARDGVQPCFVTTSLGSKTPLPPLPPE